MARLPRLAVGGQAHHVLLRGHNAQPVFIDDDDRAALLAVARERSAAEEVSVHGYALLANEIHLLLTPRVQASAMSRFVQVLARQHGARFNRRHEREGTLWSGRFRASVVDPDEWLLRCLRYVETAADSAGEPAASRWSSRPHHIGMQHDPLIDEHPAYWQLGNTPFDREAAWRASLEQALTSSEVAAIRGAASRGWALGGDGFLVSMRTLADRPVRPRGSGRPRS